MSKFDFLKDRKTLDESATDLDQEPVSEPTPEVAPSTPKASKRQKATPPPKTSPPPKRGPKKTPPLSPPAPTSRKLGRPKGGKRSDPNYEQITAYIRKDTHKAIKKRLIDDPERDFSDLVQELLEDYLS